jgi:hypothetical protein
MVGFAGTKKKKNVWASWADSIRCVVGAWAEVVVGHGRDIAVNEITHANACSLFSTALLITNSFRRNEKTYL